MSGRAVPSTLAELLGASGAIASPRLARIADRIGAEPARLLGEFVPESTEALSLGLELLTREHTGALVCGSGSQVATGNLLRGDAVLLSTEALLGIDELDAADGVMHARAGAPLSELAAAAAEAGWELPLDCPSEQATLGGVLSSATPGPRVLAHGPTRDVVLGIEIVLASGVRTRCGGRVVKNVTGYDLAKLYVGSRGSLGVIEGAWLRLRPPPRRRAVYWAAVPDPADGWRLAREVARRPSARAVAHLGLPHESDFLAPGEEGGPGILLEIGGEEALCRVDEDWLIGHLSGARLLGDGEPLRELRALQCRSAPDRVRARLHLLPSHLERSLRELAALGAELLVYPSPGIVFAWSPPGEGDALLQCLDRLERELAAQILIEDLPAALRAGRDVFGGGAQAMSLMRGLKQRFDPAGILNPGRFVGGL